MVSIQTYVSPEQIMLWRRIGPYWQKVSGEWAKDFLEECHTIACQDFKETFQTQGLLTPWEPLKLNTLRLRGKSGYNPSRPIHVRSGALYRTMTSKKAQGHDWRVHYSSKNQKATGQLRLHHPPNRSATVGLNEGVDNLIEELTSPTVPADVRVPRDLYMKQGWGVRGKAIERMTQIFGHYAYELYAKMDNPRGARATIKVGH